MKNEKFDAGEFIEFIINKVKQSKARQIYAISKLFEAI